MGRRVFIHWRNKPLVNAQFAFATHARGQRRTDSCACKAPGRVKSRIRPITRRLCASPQADSRKSAKLQTGGVLRAGSAESDRGEASGCIEGLVLVHARSA